MRFHLNRRPATTAKATLALTCAIAALTAVIPGEACAWGDEGHEIVGYIAYALLTPAAKTKVDAMLASDSDNLTAPDFASRATWADKYRDADGRRLHYAQTHLWHFVDNEISAPDLDAACFHFPALGAGVAASQGTAQDCAANKILQFEAELADPGVPDAERLLALKFVMHFVGDLHQPLHASDDHDAGGNCEQVRLAPGGRKMALHHYWDTEVVDAIIADDHADVPLSAVADHLRLSIAPTDLSNWAADDPKSWALESFQVAQDKAYALPPHAACQPGETASQYPAFVLPTDYQANAKTAAKLQLEKAGVRLAAVLNRALS